MSHRLFTIYFTGINGLTTILTLFWITVSYIFSSLLTPDHTSQKNLYLFFLLTIIFLMIDILKWISFRRIIIGKDQFILFYVPYCLFFVGLGIYDMPQAVLISFLYLPVLWYFLKRWFEKK